MYIFFIIFRLISAVWRMQYHHSLRQQMHPRHQRLYHSCQYNQELRRRHMGSSSASNPPQAAHHAPPDYANMYPHAPAVPAPMPAHLGRLPSGGLANPHTGYPGTMFYAFFLPFFAISAMYIHATAVPAPMPEHLGRLPTGGLANLHTGYPGTILMPLLPIFDHF